MPRTLEQENAAMDLLLLHIQVGSTQYYGRRPPAPRRSPSWPNPWGVIWPSRYSRWVWVISSRILTISRSMGREQGLLFGQVLAGFFQVLGNTFRLGKERFQFLVGNRLQVGHGDFVVAFAADIFGRTGNQTPAIGGGEY